MIGENERWFVTAAESSRRFYGAAAGVAVLHALLLVGVVRDFDGVAGDRGGLTHGVNVEIIDVAAFDQRTSSVSAGAQPLDSAASIVPPPEPVAEAETIVREAAPPQPPAQHLQPVEPAADARVPDTVLLATSASETEIAALTHDPKVMRLEAKPQVADARPARTPAPQSQPAPQTLSEQQRLLQSISPAALARAGAASEYTKSVSRALARSKPVSDGLHGRLVVVFVVSDGGVLVDLRLAQGSGQRDLDELVLTALRGTRFPKPPPQTPIEARTFEITYRYI